MKKIVPHNPDWEKQFQTEANLLSGLLGNVVFAIHHMGSTAIENLPAKPIIDILLEVSSINSLDVKSENIRNVGYEARGEYGINGRRYFVKRSSDDTPKIHLHAYLAGSYQIKRHIAFRDYLRAKPDVADEYARLKAKFSDQNGNLSPEYQKSKAPFVDGIALQALKYFSIVG